MLKNSSHSLLLILGIPLLSILFASGCTYSKDSARSTESVQTYGPIKGELRIPEKSLNDILQKITPPKGLVIERKIKMTTQGYEIGFMHSVRTRDDSGGELLVKDEINSTISVALGIKTKVKESLWTGPKGLTRYEGAYSETLKPDQMIISATLNSEILELDFKAHGEDKSIRQNLVRNQDYHWSTIYSDVGNRELIPGKLYDRRILDVVIGKTRPIKEKYLGIRQYKVGSHVLDCHVLWFDYGHVDATIWIAEDELGPFLVYEDGGATEGHFELFLTDYNKSYSKPDSDSGSGIEM